MTRGARLDWFALLPAVDDEARPPGEPTYDHAAILGPLDQAEAVGTLLVQHGRVGTWHTEPGRGETMVVVLADWGGDLHQVLNALPPGVIVYIEVTRRGRRQINAIGRTRRTVRRSGTQVLATYWATPTVDSPRRFIPLRAPAALRWHLRTQFVCGSLRLLAARIVTDVLSRCSQVAIELLVGSGAIVARTGRSRAPFVPALLSRSQTRAVGGDGEHVLVVTSANDAASRCVLYPFAPSEPDPRVVIKQAGHRTFNSATSDEHARQRELRARLGAAAAVVPRPLATFEVDGFAVSVETVARGRTLNALVGSIARSERSKLSELNDVVDALSRFGVAAHGRQIDDTMPQRLDHEQRREVLIGPTRELRRIVTMCGTTAQFVSDVEAHLELYARGTGPLIEQHFDTGPWNIYYDRGAVTLIDWECDAIRDPYRLGVPGTDVAYLVQYWYFALRRLNGRDAEVRGLERLMLNDDPSSLESALRGIVGRHVAHFGCGREHVALAFGAMWVERAWNSSARLVSLRESDVHVDRQDVTEPLVVLDWAGARCRDLGLPVSSAGDGVG